MARISVEQKALTDRRFKTLARLLGENKYSALGRMVYVWNECQEAGSYYVENYVLDDIFPDVKGFGNLVVECNLATRIRGGKVRIKGTEGRIEWLLKARANGRFGRLGAASGKKGGRPRLNPQSGDKKTPDWGGPINPPPSPSPSNKDINKDINKKTPRPKDLEEVVEYAKTRSGIVDPEYFFDRNEGTGWVDKNGNPYKDWKAVFRTWEKWAVKDGKRSPSPLKSQKEAAAEQYARVGSGESARPKTPEEEDFDRGNCPNCGGTVSLKTGKTFHDIRFACDNCGLEKKGA